MVRQDEIYLDEANHPDDVLGKWWLMHHSQSDKRRTIGVAHYIDDSGSDERAKLAVVGGPIFSRQRFFSFHYEWDRLTERIAIRSDGSRVGHIHQEVSRKQTEGLAAAIRTGGEPLKRIGRLELAKWIKDGVVRPRGQKSIG